MIVRYLEADQLADHADRRAQVVWISGATVDTCGDTEPVLGGEGSERLCSSETQDSASRRVE